MSKKLSLRNTVDVLNKTIEIFTSFQEKSFEDVMASGMLPVAEAMGLDRIVVYNKLRDGQYGQFYRWDKAAGGTIPIDERLKFLPSIPVVMQWFAIVSRGECIIRRLDKMSDDEVDFSKIFGIKSIALVPIFTHGKFWGGITFQDHTKERDFDEFIDLLQSVARLCASAAIREEMRQENYKTIEMLEQRKKLSDILNETAITFVSQNEESVDARIEAGVRSICDTVKLDRFSIWRNFDMPDGMHTSQVYRWDRASGGTTKPTPELKDISYANYPLWKETLMGNNIINGPASLQPASDILKLFGVVSAFVVPLFIKDAFWGFVLAEDRYNERYFENDYVEIMRLASFLSANIVISSQMEREIAEAEQLNKLLINSAPISIFICDENLQMINCNATVLEMFNCTEKYFNEHFLDLSPEYQPDGSRSRHRASSYIKSILNGEKMTFEWTHASASGEPIPCEVTALPHKHNGKNMGLCYLYDLRSRKKMMDSIHKQGEQLAFQLEQQKLISEISNSFISFGNSYALINEALGKLGKNFGMSRVFIYCMNYKNIDAHAVYKWYASNDVPKFQDNHGSDIFNIIKTIYLENSSESSTISYANTNADAEILSKLKSMGIISFICTPLYIENRLWGVVSAQHCFLEHEWKEEEISFFTMISNVITGAITRDIYETKLKETLDKVTKLSKAKDDFLAKMSHEIRTPMNAILGVTEVQLQDETISQKVREGLGVVYNSSDSLLRVINDLLDLSKIEAKKLEITPIKYEIASLINDTVQLNMMRIKNKPIEFKLNVDEGIPAEFFGDELRIKQILNNILSNAFKYTDSGEISMSVSAEKKENSDVILILTVSDTGLGMTKEQINRIFDEYSRFNSVNNQVVEGTGLGMTITRDLVSLMNGEISIESEPGKGSVFTIRLPQKIVGEKVLGKDMLENLHKLRIGNLSQIKKAQIVHESMPYGKVLVVDDVESNLYVAKHLLAPYDLSIDTASSGFEAIEKIKNGKVYDIVFMDQMMPKMDGVETVKIMRNLGYAQPIIALTANAIAGQAKMFFENSFDGFISKPIDTIQLNAELNKYIRDKQVSKEAMPLVPPFKADAELRLIFAQDVRTALSVLESTFAHIDTLANEDFDLYAVTAHGVKSGLTNIGESALAQIAFTLEKAGKEQDKGIIKARTQELVSALKEIVAEIEAENS
jgi:signal transduction histidine kinase/CheY-like chemotaxis protein/HPt (histidine-containing phosphotransfer) domain-containing protein/PAS domain-containing protein